MLFCLLLLFQTSPDAGELYPYPHVWQRAAALRNFSRALFSDEPLIYRFTWSSALSGPCPKVLSVEDGDLPCSALPFEPDPRRPELPAVLYLAYQQLTYTAPHSPDRPKASLALSWRFTLISAGVIWELSVNAEGIKHDVFLCEYEHFDTRVQILPLVFIDVVMLRPKRYHHLTVEPSGQYTLQVHRLQDWRLPTSLFSVGLFCDVFHDLPHCGTPAYVYTTRPSEDLMAALGAFVADVPELTSGDQQTVVTPMLGFEGCGEYPFGLFHRFMTHRDPATPSRQDDGPPLETWTFTGERDIAASTAAATDPGAEPAHSKVAGVRDDLQDAGLQGAFVQDSNLIGALEGQTDLEATRFKRGADFGDQALTVMEILADNPRNLHLLELFRNFIEPHLAYIDHVTDTEIEFNPFLPHCTLDPELGTLPILGAHFFEEPPEDCGFCVYHDRIVAEPYRSWAHHRLLEQDWVWEPIHGPRGNLYQKALGFIQAVTQSHQNMTDLQNTLGQRQVSEAHQDQLPTVTLAELEAEPSDTTANTTQSATGQNLPPFLTAPYDPCADPSWTIQYLFIYRELLDIFAAPCGLLWGVAPP